MFTQILNIPIWWIIFSNMKQQKFCNLISKNIWHVFRRVEVDIASFNRSNVYFVLLNLLNIVFFYHERDVNSISVKLKRILKLTFLNPITNVDILISPMNKKLQGISRETFCTRKQSLSSSTRLTNWSKNLLFTTSLAMRCDDKIFASFQRKFTHAL